MRVFCINDRNNIGLKSPYYTKGKWYDATISLGDMYYIKADDETYPAVPKSNFIKLEEYRNSLIDKILNERS